MKVTPWFSVRQPPVREGWYEVMWDEKNPGADGPGFIERQWWCNGRFRYVFAESRGEVITIRLGATGMGGEPGDKWRGLRKPASEGTP